MDDLCDDVQGDVGQIDLELLNHDETQDGEYMGDQQVEVLLVDGYIFRKRQEISLLDLGVDQGLSQDGPEAEEEPEVHYPDYTERMHASAVVDDMVPAGSCERQGIGRYRRFAR